MEVWDYVNSLFKRLRGDASGRAVTLPEGQYLETPPTLTDEDYHHLILTSDGRLLTVAALYGWTGSAWKEVLVDADGKLDVV